MTTDFNDRFDKALDIFEPAQFRLDVGYQDKIDIDDGCETRFISRGKSIGLDKFEELTAESSNELCRIIQETRSELVSQITDVAKILEPGEERIIANAGSLEIHLRRLNVEQPPVKAEEQTFAERQAMVG
jgi:hypothetical protein